MRVSRYIATRMPKIMGLKKRSFIKNIPMRDSTERDTQFRHIQEILPRALEDSGTVVLSIDTKKKELIGNFKRGGKVWCQGIPQSFDHDFETVSNCINGIMVIYCDGIGKINDVIHFIIEQP